MKKSTTVKIAVVVPVIAAVGVIVYEYLRLRQANIALYEKDCVIERSFEETKSLEGRLAAIKEKHERMTHNAE